MAPATHCVLLTAALLAGTASSHAAITFNFTYQDVILDNNRGFDDPTFGASRRATVEAVGTYLNTVFEANGDADIHWVESMVGAGVSILGQMGSYYPQVNLDSTPPYPPGFHSSALYRHAIDGFDLTGSDLPDSIGVINFSHTWNSELDAPTGIEYDLFSVVLHETIHGFGFASLITSNGGYVSSDLTGIRSIYDSHLYGPSGRLLDNNGVFVGNVSDLTSGELTFRGPEAMAANGGEPVPIYSPAAFQSGSSISHTDRLPLSVMNPSISVGEVRRTLTGIEIGMIADLAQAAVPEPRDIAIVFGAGLLVFASCRRQAAPLP